MYRNILLPVDDSEVSLEVAREGVRLAKLSGATPIAVAVVEHTLTYPPPLTMSSWNELYPEQIAAARERLQKLQEQGGSAGLTVQIHLRYGHPVQEILTVAEEEEADLIVMAAHHGRIATLLLGSVSQEIVRNAPCPVQIFGRKARLLHHIAQEAAPAQGQEASDRV